MRFLTAVLITAVLMPWMASAKTEIAPPDGDQALWDVFKTACLDEYPSFQGFNAYLDALGFNPPHLYIAGKAQPNRWRGKLHVRYNSYSELGIMHCRVTRWQDDIVLSHGQTYDGCFGVLKREPSEWETVNLLGEWVQSGREVAVVAVRDVRRCDAFMLLSAEPKP